VFKNPRQNNEFHYEKKEFHYVRYMSGSKIKFHTIAFPCFSSSDQLAGVFALMGYEAMLTWSSFSITLVHMEHTYIYSLTHSLIKTQTTNSASSIAQPHAEHSNYQKFIHLHKLVLRSSKLNWSPISKQKFSFLLW